MGKIAVSAVVGRGRHLFEGTDLGDRKPDLIEIKTFATGVVRLIYVVR